MAGTKLGAAKAAHTNVSKYGKGFYARIGAIGGANGNTGGFYNNRELASRAGKLGGARSRRTWSKEEREAHGQKIQDAFREEQQARRRNNGA